MKRFLHLRLILPIVTLLKEGVTPEKIALSLAFGIVLGTFPVLGTTTLLCAVAAFALKLNLPAIQMVNYLMYPVQLLLILPFTRMGEHILHAQATMLSLPEMFAMARVSVLGAISQLWIIAVHAMLAWAILAPVAIYALYSLFAFFLVRTTRAIQRKRAATGYSDAA